MYRRTRVARRRRTHRRRRHVFGKKAVRAIKAISQRPVETKWHLFNSDLLIDPPLASWPAGTGTGSGFAVMRNILDPIPRSNNTLSESRNEVVGQEFQLRGISVRGMIGWDPSTSGGIPSTMRVRISIVQSQDYINQPIFAPYSGSGAFYEDDGTLPITDKKFNMDKIKILKTKTFHVGGEARSSIVAFKLWLKLRRKVVCFDDEGSGVTGTFVYKVKGMQYYLFVETLAPGGYSWATSTDFFQLSTQVYFKDA